MYTLDGGTNWTEQVAGPNGTNLELYSVFFTDTYTGWICGNWGALFKTTTSGDPTPVRENGRNSVALPRDFALRQNYPNPFNPSTAIQFSLPKTTHVTLKVYNILGEEVATLLNTQMNIGNHTIAWNPQGLPSGIYLYRLRADGFTSTRKMILQK